MTEQPIPQPPIRVGVKRPRLQRKDPLTRDRIVDTTLTMMAAEGYDAVSMRSLARALETGPASIYAHVSGRDELDQLVLARITAQLRIPQPDRKNWAEQVKQICRDMLELYRAHPGSARAAMAAIPTELSTLDVAEGMMAILLAGGISATAASWFCDLGALYVAATAYEELVWLQRETVSASGEPVSHDSVDAQFTDYFASLPTDRFPLLSSLAETMTSGGGEERFEFGLDVLLAGVAAVSKQQKSAARNKR